MAQDKEIVPSQEEFAALQAAQGEVLAEQEAQIEALKAELKEVKASAGGGEKVVIVKSGVPVSIGKKNYLVVHGLIIEGKELTAAQIASDKALCEKLVSKNSSAIKAV